MGIMSRFEATPAQQRERPIRNGAIVLGIFLALSYYAYTSGNIPFFPKGGEVVTATFRTAANVSPGKTPVRVSGVNVGEVEKVERLPGARGVKVTMRINDDGVKLRKDAGAHIYWRTLLGFAFYIDLDQGSSSEALGDTTIPMSRTSAQVELDTVLSSLTPPSREGIRSTLDEFSEGFKGNVSIGSSVDQLGPAMEQAAPGLDALRGVRAGDLTDTVRSTSRLMGALARNEDDLGQVIAHADTTLGVTAARRAAISQTLQQGPGTLDQTVQTMTRLRTTLDELDPIAEKLRPGARVLDDASLAVRPALRQLGPTLDDARPLLADLRPALTSLRTASRNGVPFLDALEPTLVRTRDTILPGVNKRGFTGLKLYEAIGPAASTVSSSASLYDAYGFTQRFQAVNAGTKSLGVLPCSADIVKGKIDCDSVNSFVSKILGLTPPEALGTSTRSGAAASGSSGAKAGPTSGASSSGGSSSGGSQSQGEGTKPSDDPISRVGALVGGVFK